MTIDLLSFIVVTALSGGIGLILLYFVIKAAVTNALYAERGAQARIRVLQEQADRAQRSSQ